MKIGFTGTRDGMSARQKEEVTSLFKKGKELNFGDCSGADCEAFRIAQKLSMKTVCWPPTNERLRMFCKADIVKPAEDYLTRNRRIVNASELVIAAPKEFLEPIQKRGGGTWATIRYARKIKKPLVIVFPDGTKKREN
jgi:hypothetical protein